MKRRADVNAETMPGRLKANPAQTPPLATYFHRKGVLERINAMRAIADIRSTPDRILGRMAV